MRGVLGGGLSTASTVRLLLREPLPFAAGSLAEAFGVELRFFAAFGRCSPSPAAGVGASRAAALLLTSWKRSRPSPPNAPRSA